MLLDLKLPDMEGQDIIQRLNEGGRAIPFIIITGQGDERVAVDMMKRGALDYLVKDVQFIEFIPTVVQRALQKLQTDAQLSEARAALEESRTQLLAVSEREQRHLGAELHDGLGQQLTAIELMCESLKQDLPSKSPEQEQLSVICKYLREAVSQTRALAHGLAPVQLGNGLCEALRELTERMSKNGRLKCSFDSPPTIAVTDDVAAGHLFRIAQEAVNNAAKHSNATQVLIRMTSLDGNGSMRLEVSDNGAGLPQTVDSRGIGLQIMKHRASVIGGQLEVKSQPGKGVTVSCVLPAMHR